MIKGFIERVFVPAGVSPYEVLQRSRTLDIILRVILVAGFCEDILGR